MNKDNNNTKPNDTDKKLHISDVSEQLPISEILDNEYKRLMKHLYPNKRIKLRR